jgi:hypothetical protein
MRKAILLSILWLPLYSFAFTWQVGPTRTYTLPSQVAPLVNNGDTVEIDAAIYLGDVCVWPKNNLLLKGVGGRPHLRANGNNAIGKGTWVFAGNNIRVENIEFSEASVPDQNGAGIRLDGVGINVKNCYFHNNENGILTNNNGGTILIGNSEFAFNGFGDGQSHNIYIGSVDTAIIRFSYFHHAKVGHELKSRARVNYIFYNRLSNEATGIASREIDLPNGGVSILIGNIIQQGPNSQNGNIIGYGLEGLANAAPHEIYLINNTLVNERFTGSFLQANAGTTFIKVYNNIFAGPGTVINYAGPAGSLDSLTNKVASDIGQMGFVNAAAYDYHVSTGSIAVNGGTNPGLGPDGINLNPVFEYLHPISSTNRILQNTIDIGGYELVGALPVSILKFAAFIQQAQTVIQWQTAEETGIDSYDLQGSNDGVGFEKITNISAKNRSVNDYEWIELREEEVFYYRLKIIEKDGTFRFSKIVLIRKSKISESGARAVFAGEKLYLFNLPGDFKNSSGYVQIFNASGVLLSKQAMNFKDCDKLLVANHTFASLNGYVLVVIGKANHRLSVAVDISNK